MTQKNKAGELARSNKKGAQIASNAADPRKVASMRFKTGEEDPVNLLISIIRQQHSLWKKEIQDWIAAQSFAQRIDYPNRVLLYRLYDDIIKDPVIHGQVYNQRILKISNKKFKIVNDQGDKDDEKTELLQRNWFNDFVKYAMESIFYGHSLVYFNKIDTEVREIKLFYREHVRPEHNLILKMPYDTSGMDYTESPYDNYLIPIGAKENLGLLNKAAPLFILKKHSWANWDQFEEMFGMPIRWAKTASTDPKVRAQIEGWLKDMGSAAYGMFPLDTQFEIKESTRPDAFGVFNEKRKAANEELAILFNGQTMTITDGSSRSQAEVHERSQEEITKDDATLILYLINSALLPLLIKHGYPLQGYKFRWDESIELTVEQKVKVFKTISDMGYEIEKDEIEQAFGVTIVGLKQVKNSKDKDNQEGDPKPEPQPKPAKEPPAKK